MWDFVVLNVFPHEVPIVFPMMYFQHVPNSSSLHPIFFASCFTPATYINSPKEEVTLYLVWDGPKVDLFSFFLVMGQTKMPITKEKKLNFWRFSQLINVNRNVLPYNRVD